LFIKRHALNKYSILPLHQSEREQFFNRGKETWNGVGIMP
jgi:hypothetical protein